MDLQNFVDGFHNSTCIVSVEKNGDGYGDICIAAANNKFRKLLGITGGNNSADIVYEQTYDRYIPKDTGFEDLCYRAAVLKEPINTNIHPNKLNMWVNVFVLPLDFEDGNTCYCAYTMKKREMSDVDLGASHSAESLEDVVKTCIKLYGTNDFQKTLNDIMSDIRILCGAAICTLSTIDISAGTFSVLAASRMEEHSRRSVTNHSNFYDIAFSWIDTIGDSDCLIIRNEKDLEYISRVNPLWYESLSKSRVQSIVMFPLRFNNEILGFIWATNFDTKNTMRIKETLELTTFFISSQLANFRMMKRLEHISYTDMLTGVMNRNAMNNRIIDITTGTDNLNDSYGIVFADLNGLKNVNDTLGHSAGDRMLKKAAIILQEFFEGDEIYRAGGDEFMIIVPDSTEEDFEKKVSALREHNRKSGDICFAVGSYFPAKGCDIRDAMHIADEDMYRDKDTYYRTYPERKTR